MPGGRGKARRACAMCKPHKRHRPKRGSWLRKRSHVRAEDSYRQQLNDR